MTLRRSRSGGDVVPQALTEYMVLLVISGLIKKESYWSWWYRSLKPGERDMEYKFCHGSHVYESSWKLFIRRIRWWWWWFHRAAYIHTTSPTQSPGSYPSPIRFQIHIATQHKLRNMKDWWETSIHIYIWSSSQLLPFHVRCTHMHK